MLALCFFKGSDSISTTTAPAGRLSVVSNIYHVSECFATGGGERVFSSFFFFFFFFFFLGGGGGIKDTVLAMFPWLCPLCPPPPPPMSKLLNTLQSVCIFSFTLYDRLSAISLLSSDCLWPSSFIHVLLVFSDVGQTWL